ncbi:sugar ABC transporter permease [Paenibacillus mesophilus]|nr:sugar ABC transporter permease [Paenibacillus mesophilus]
MALYGIFALPFVYFVVFHYVPMVGTIIAFQDYSIVKGVRHSPWAGTMYFRMFLTDPYFWKVVRNTVLLNVYSLLFAFPAPIAFAVLLHELRSRMFRRLVQTVACIPHFLSTVVVAGMLVNFLSTDGWVNRIVRGLGGEARTFLALPEWFRTIFIGSDIWQNAGWNSIIYLAAIASVNPRLYEAAAIDGAGRWNRLAHVTLPGISRVIAVMLLLAVGQMLSVGYEKIMLLYNGPTYETADVIQTFVYRRGLIDSDLSFAAAVGLFQSVTAFILIVAANGASKRLNGTGLF